jgi:hypothetical protein
MNVFEYSILVTFIPNQTTCFLNILETLSYKKLKIYNINTIFYFNTENKKLVALIMAHVSVATPIYIMV